MLKQYWQVCRTRYKYLLYIKGKIKQTKKKQPVSYQINFHCPIYLLTLPLKKNVNIQDCDLGTIHKDTVC